MEKATSRGALWFVLFTKYYSGDQIKKNEMGRACGTCDRQERGVQGFGGKTGEKKPLCRTRYRGGGSIGWIDLVYDRDRWRALVHAVMNHRAP